MSLIEGYGRMNVEKFYFKLLEISGFGEYKEYRIF